MACFLHYGPLVVLLRRRPDPAHHVHPYRYPSLFTRALAVGALGGGGLVVASSLDWGLVSRGTVGLAAAILLADRALPPAMKPSGRIRCEPAGYGLLSGHYKSYFFTKRCIPTNVLLTTSQGPSP